MCGEKDPLPALTEEQTTAFDEILPRILHLRVKKYGMDQTMLEAKTEMQSFRHKSGLYAGSEKGETRMYIVRVHVCVLCITLRC